MPYPTLIQSKWYTHSHLPPSAPVVSSNWATDMHRWQPAPACKVYAPIMGQSAYVWLLGVSCRNEGSGHYESL